MRGRARGGASGAAVLLGAAALSACGVGRSYRPASVHAVEDGGVRVEATGVGVGQLRGGPPVVGTGVRITTASPVRLEGVRLASSAAEACGAGQEPSASYRLDARGRREPPFASDLAPGTIDAGALFPVPAARLAPAGPAGLDVTLTREGAPRCLRVPLAAAAEDDWRERRGVVLGLATRGQWGVRDDGASKARWLPFVVAVGYPIGPGRGAIEGSGSMFAVSWEAPVLRRATSAAVASLGYETDVFSSGGPRLGVRLLRTVARTGWTGYREVALAPGWGLDVYASRWWPLGASGVDAWVFTVGLSWEYLLASPERD